jgi:hypothetical protein
MVNRLPAVAVTAFLVLGATTPATAGTLSLKLPTIGGDAPTDYLVYDANGLNTFAIDRQTANLENILAGNSSNPTGNIELAASSEKTGFDFTKATTLQGTIGGKSLTISSLTQKDWDATSQEGLTFGRYWFNQALSANGYGDLTKISFGGVGLFDVFRSYGGLQRFSDPNIAYVNQDTTTGEVKIGLAGHFDATSLFTSSIDQFVASTTTELSKAQTSLDQANATLTQLQSAYAAVPATVVVRGRTVPNPNYDSQRTQIQQQITQVTTTIATITEGMTKAREFIAIGQNVRSTLGQRPLQASEVLKYTYDNGESQYGYSFVATKSGLTEKGDGISHSGNYEVSFQGVKPASERKVPEPSLLLGLASVGGFMALKRRQRQNNA